MGNRIVEGLSALTKTSEEIANDIYMLDFRVVNAFLIGEPNSNSGEWVLIDTGLENSGEFIKNEASKRFGEESRPKAIVLTHGHFDHVGSVKELAEYWDVPVYAHSLEIPYITGKKDYPVGDPAADEGLVAKMSPGFPHTRIDIGFRAVQLPEDGSIPGMPGWIWVHTPGHTEGHIALFRERDGMLIAGDALSNVKQESLWAVLTQKKKISGPPKYLTSDWRRAEESVCRLKDLDPCMILPSHGRPMKGDEAEKHLKYLAEHFNEIAKPAEQ
ncbi:MAG TPA: MBL fold metallo-hydrolase [Clostridiales bacterium]|nr:MBL fold metallo-hydrolase [Clostridiales bacterium]